MLSEGAGGRRRGRRERGSVLLLVPAGVMVLVVLGAIAVDFSIAFLAQRELTNAAAAAANDAAAAAIDERTFYEGTAGAGAGRIVVDEARARAVAERALDARLPRGVRDPRVSVETHPRTGQVCVRVVGRADYVFSRSVPGAPDHATVRGEAVATPVLDGAAIPRDDGFCGDST